jgi:hypothetical protein
VKKLKKSRLESRAGRTIRLNRLNMSFSRGIRFLLVDREVESKSRSYPLYISFGSFLVALASFYFSYFGLPGKVTVGTPDGYGIIRGELNNYINKYSGPSDHLILPLVWHNTKKYSAVITGCKLILTEVDKYGQEEEANGESYKFILAGQYSEISDDILKREYMILPSFILPGGGDSNTRNILLFHLDKYYDSNNLLYKHKFKQNKKYQVKLEFCQDGKEAGPIILFNKMPIFIWREASVERSWEFWYRVDSW